MTAICLALLVPLVAACSGSTDPLAAMDPPAAASPPAPPPPPPPVADVIVQVDSGTTQTMAGFGSTHLSLADQLSPALYLPLNDVGIGSWSSS